MNQKDMGLESEIKSIVQTLKKSKKHSLAKCIEENWHKTALAYSAQLNTWTPKRPMEQELLNAFSGELERLETEEVLKLKIIESLARRRVLQTGPHLGVTLSARMLCINWLESLGIEEGDFDVVGMFSGIPFSNQSRPGRINKKEGSVNLFPSNMQDALVYRSLIPSKLVETVQGLSKEQKELLELRKLLPKAVLGNSYTKWAIKGCENIQRQILGKENIVFLDINEVITAYLLEVLTNKEHVMYKIFFDPEMQKEFMKAFPDEIMFYSPVMDGNFESMENLVMSEGMLKSHKGQKNKQILLVDPRSQDGLIEELQTGRLCPGLITGFLVLAFLNNFKCFGSFAQVEYLPAYQEKLATLSFLKGYNVSEVPTANLTTGSFPENLDLYPTDAIIEDIKVLANKDILFGELLIPIKDLLISSYFTGDARKSK